MTKKFNRIGSCSRFEILRWYGLGICEAKGLVCLRNETKQNLVKTERCS